MFNKDEDVVVESQRDLIMPKIPVTTGKRNRLSRLMAIKALIEANPGKIIKLSDINKAADIKNGQYYLTDLINRGIVVRYTIDNGERGHSYAYKWVGDSNTLLPHAIQEVRNDVESQKGPTYTYEDIEKLAANFVINNGFGDKDENTIALKQRGVVQFLEMLQNKNNSAPQE